MKTLTIKEAYGRNLPKWPQLVITGKPVTVEQAKEIIYRTDSFMAPYAHGGNNAEWVNWANHVLGRYELDNMQDTGLKWRIFSEMSVELGRLELNYLSNDWISSCFVWGPHGWCSPDGVIAHTDNVGKWPSVEEIHNDLKLMVGAFPYLEMTGTLHDKEGCEVDGTDEEIEKSKVITFVVKNGKIRFTDEHDKHHFAVELPRRNFDAMNLNDRIEQGVPDSWIIGWSERYNDAIGRAKDTVSKMVD